MSKMTRITKALGGKWKRAKGFGWTGYDGTTKSGKGIRICQNGDGTSNYPAANDEPLDVHMFESLPNGLHEGEASFGNGIPEAAIVAFLKELAS